MEAVYATLGLLLVSMLSGLAYLAVKHPRTFRVSSLGLVFAAFVLLCGALAFSFGASAGAYALQPFLRPGSAAEAKATVDQITLACFLVAFGFLALTLIILVLAKISTHIHKSEGGKNGADEGGE